MMSNQGGNAATAAPANPSDLSHDLLGLGDPAPTSSQRITSVEESRAQNHKRSVSAGSSSDFGAADITELSHGSLDETETRRQPYSGLEGGVTLKGKETNPTETEESQGHIRGEVCSVSQRSDGVQVEEDIHLLQPNYAHLTQEETPRRSVPAGRPRRSSHQTSDIQANDESSNSEMVTSPFTQRSSTWIPSFNAQGNLEEDSQNRERIQAISGPSNSRYNYISARPDSSPDIAARSPSRASQKRKSISSENPRTLDGAGPGPSTSRIGLSRPPSYDDSFSSGRNLTRQGAVQRPTEEVLVPRWQPDAEVTFCPICATQFSFFVRKHHCRKCGRVVCNACSPHRITIPYQFIVQPPTEGGILNEPSSHARPALDPLRAGGSSEFETLGGGERVRLCNPCVPDPNTAPPQTPQFSNSLQDSARHAHIRSASSTNTYPSPSQYTWSSSNPSERAVFTAYSSQNPVRHARQSSISGRPSVTRNPSTNAYSDQPFADPRSRSFTVSGSPVPQDQNPTRPRVPGSVSAGVSGVPPSSGSPAIRGSISTVPRVEQQARPLPRVPRPPRIAEEDECPVCHQELPSSQLPNSEALRAEHITNCIDNAMKGTASTPPIPIASPRVASQAGASTMPSSSTSTPALVPIANTPQARMAAREQAHAAVVLGQRSSPSPAFRRTGVFPYKATEKDCVDDAECTICLEEFEVGQDMGRLECFCRFHLHCIREWFVNHYGQCPVHHQAY